MAWPAGLAAAGAEILPLPVSHKLSDVLKESVLSQYEAGLLLCTGKLSIARAGIDHCIHLQPSDPAGEALLMFF